MPSLRSAAAAGLLAASAACGSGQGQISTPPTEPSPPATVAREPSSTCEAPEAGYRLRYPATWHTAGGPEVAPCRFFHPEPFVLPAQSEATGIAVVVKMEPVAFADVAPRTDTFASELLERRDAVVAGRPAVRAETRATGRGLLPTGVRGVAYYVDFGDRTLVAVTSETAAAGTLQSNAAVLDRMMATLTAVEPDAGACSAAGMAPRAPGPGAELPPAVVATRGAIVEAAAACDYGALADLAAAGPLPFTHSYQERAGAAESWRRRERAGEPVLRILVEILRLPPAARPAGPTTRYVWPAAFAYERWEEVPAEARQALRSLYGEAELDRFAGAGSYTGARAGIAGDGEWVYYVTGD